MLNEDIVKKIHADIDLALRDIAKKYKLTVAPSHVRYNSSTFKLTAEFGDQQETGGIDPKLLNNTKRHGWKFRLDVVDINKSFSHGTLGKTTFLGMSGTQKAAIKAENGKIYLMKARDVATYLKK